MPITTPKVEFDQNYRIQVESSFGAGGGSADWAQGGNGGGATGWRDWPVSSGQPPIPAIEPAIFAAYKAGGRTFNNQGPVPGAYSVDHSLETPLFLESCHPFWYGVLGGQSLVETAGDAALASTAFASVATLDTQPDGTEVLKFVVASSTAASAASIEIIQNSVTVETVTIGTSASSVDGTYYSKGAYDGSTNAITFSVNGTVTSGTVVVSGVDYVTGTFTVGSTIPSFQIQEFGVARSGSNAFHYPGVVISSVDVSFDRTALDGLIVITPTFASQFPTAQTNVAYNQDPRDYYHPLGNWVCSLTKGGSAFEKVKSMNLTIDGGNLLFPVATGAQNPAGKLAGAVQVSGTIRLIDEDTTEWDDYVGQTVADMHLVFTSPQNIVDSTKWSMTMEFTQFFIETFTPVIDDASMIGVDIGFRTVNDSSDGPIKITTVDRMPV